MKLLWGSSSVHCTVELIWQARAASVGLASMFAVLDSVQEELGSITNRAKRKAARKAAEFAYFSSRSCLRACTKKGCCLRFY